MAGFMRIIGFLQLEKTVKIIFAQLIHFIDENIEKKGSRVGNQLAQGHNT